jgi:sugar (pentulose or hexulose) kinase
VAQQYLADALKTPVACMKTASEGGPWGMAVLAAYASRRTEGETAKLEDFLAKSVFAGAEFSVCHPIEEGVAGFAAYVDNFKEAIHA